MDSLQFYFSHPTSIVIAGPSRSGKTCFVFNCLKSSLIQPFPSRIIWFYKEWQPIYDKLKKLFRLLNLHRELIKGILAQVKAYERNLVVLDDLMSSAGDSKQIAQLFTQDAHHGNLTVIFIVQNLFYQGKEMRTINLNAHYIILYKTHEINRKFVIWHTRFSLKIQNFSPKFRSIRFRIHTHIL